MFSLNLFYNLGSYKGGFMGKNLGEIINHIMEENTTKRVIILTEQLYISGSIHDYHEKCENCHECLIALKDVRIARINALEKCKNSTNNCSEDIFAEYKWFNINADSIVGFSVIGENQQ